MSKRPMVRMYLSEGETGWAEDVGEAQYRIANIPFDGDFNIDDVVEVERQKEGPPKAKTLVSRKFNARTAIYIDKDAQFIQVRALVEEAGGKAEGYVKSSSRGQGIIGVALPEEADVIRIVNQLGVKQPKDWEANTL